MKKIIIGLVVVFFSFFVINTNVLALDCSSGSCYCNADGECGIYRNPRGDKTIYSDMSKCGCPDSSLDTDMEFCLDTSAIWQFVGYILLALKTIVPLVIIIFGIIDLAKAVASSDDKAVTKATSSIVKRIIMGIAIFFIPTIVSFVFSMLKNAAPIISGAEECQVCLLRPTSEDCEDYVSTAETNRDKRKEYTYNKENGSEGEPSNGDSSSGSGTATSNNVEITLGSVKSVSLSSLSCDVYFSGNKLKSISMNETISSQLLEALKSLCTFLKNNSSKYNVSDIHTAGTYNLSTTPAYPHVYAMGIDLFNEWTYTYNGKTYTPYSEYGPTSYTKYNEFICEVCNGKENCEANLNYKIYETIFKPLGFCWGGNWSKTYHDPMHFEYSRLNNKACSVQPRNFNC